MHELVVLLALLARAWDVLNRLQAGGAIPCKIGPEFDALRQDLSSFFADPVAYLPKPVQPVYALPPSVEEEGMTAVKAKEIADNLSPSPKVLYHEKCSDCDGDGFVKKFIGPRGKTTCETCGGKGMVPKFAEDPEDDGSTQRDVP